MLEKFNYFLPSLNMMRALVKETDTTNQLKEHEIYEVSFLEADHDSLLQEGLMIVELVL